MDHDGQAELQKYENLGVLLTSFDHPPSPPTPYSCSKMLFLQLSGPVRIFVPVPLSTTLYTYWSGYDWFSGNCDCDMCLFFTLNTDLTQTNQVEKVHA